MILPDVNLLLHSYNSSSHVHQAARQWWEDLLSDGEPVRLAWMAVLGFIRLGTHRQISAHPLPIRSACAIVESWLELPQVEMMHPGTRHASILFDLLRTVGAGGNLTTDAHLAALAIEHGAELCTTDSDFSRFPGLRWRDPLSQS